MDKKEKHKLLKLQAMEMLKSWGFSENEVKFEYTVGEFRADVVGIKKGYKAVIECGRTPIRRYRAFKKEFDKVKILRYRDYVPLKKRYNPPVFRFVTIRLDKADVDLLRKVVKKRGTSISEFIREATTEHLGYVQKYGEPNYLNITKRLRELESNFNEVKAKLKGKGILNGL